MRRWIAFAMMCAALSAQTYEQDVATERARYAATAGNETTDTMSFGEFQEVLLLYRKGGWTAPSTDRVMSSAKDRWSELGFKKVIFAQHWDRKNKKARTGVFHKEGEKVTLLLYRVEQLF